MKNYLLITALLASTIPSQTQASDFSKGVCIGVGITGIIGALATHLYTINQMKHVIRASDDMYTEVNELKKTINEQTVLIREITDWMSTDDENQTTEGSHTDQDRRDAGTGICTSQANQPVVGATSDLCRLNK